MNRLFLAAVTLSIGAAPALYAANGANLLGVSPASTALGGTGVANYTNETDAMYKNPALIGAYGGTSILDVELSSNFFKNAPTATGLAGTTASSQSGVKLLPNAVATYKMDSLAVGLGAMTYGGGVVDYTGVARLGQVKTENYFTRIQVGASYKINDMISVGIAPFLIYSGLGVSDDFQATGTQTVRSADTRTAFAGQIGVTVKPSETVHLGATFITRSSDLNFKQIVNLRPLGPQGPRPGLNDITVNQPAEIAAGIGFKATENIRLTFDYRFIAWSKTKGLGEGNLGWSDQSVFAVGGEYQMDKLALRMGFNYGDSPIKNSAGATDAPLVNFQGTDIYPWGQSLLNLAAFPGVAKANLTLGAGYWITEKLFADLGFQYSFASTITHTGNAPSVAPFNGGAAYSFNVSSKQWSIAAGVGYRF